VGLPSPASASSAAEERCHGEGTSVMVHPPAAASRLEDRAKSPACKCLCATSHTEGWLMLERCLSLNS
jgi:hypothetical protein